MANFNINVSKSFDDIMVEITKLNFEVVGETPPRNWFEKIKRKHRLSTGMKEIETAINRYEISDIEEAEIVLRNCMNMNPPNGKFGDINSVFHSVKKFGNLEKFICVSSIIKTLDERHEVHIYTISISTEHISVSSIYRTMTLTGKVEDTKCDFTIQSFRIPVEDMRNPDLQKRNRIIQEIYDILLKTAKDLLLESLNRLERIEV